MNRQLRALEHIFHGKDYLSSQQLADELKISEKTVSTRIKEFNYIAENNGAIIKSKRGLGYKLFVLDEKKYDELLQQNGFKNTIKTSEDRILGLVIKLMAQTGPIKLDDLSEEWFISKSTLSNDLKKVEASLNAYNIKLIRKPYYGIGISGSEINIRTYIAEHILYHDFVFFDNKVRLDKMKAISEVVVPILRKKHFTMSEVFLHDFLMYIFIAVERIKSGFGLSTSFEVEDNILDNNVIEATNEIIENIENRTNIIISEYERTYIAIHLAGKRTINSQKHMEHNILISTHILELIKNMLDAVYEAFNIDFKNNLELRLSLGQHLVPLNIRLRYNLLINNPLLDEIKTKYLFAYTLAARACIPLKEYYKEISEDEIGYIALLFALALERKQRNIPKKNILIVCSSGKGTSQLLMHRFKNEFDEYINDIKSCDTFELPFIDFSNINYIFTTVPIKIHVPIPIIEIHQFLDSSELTNVKDVLAESDKSLMHNYYKEDLFFAHIKGTSRDEVLKEMCEKLGEKRNIPESFYKAVIIREKLISTDLGNLVVFPHPYKVMTDETFICVGILENPIMWSKNQVQIIFMISISNNKTEDLQEFYKNTTNLLFNKQSIEKIIKYKSFDMLMELL